MIEEKNISFLTKSQLNKAYNKIAMAALNFDNIKKSAYSNIIETYLSYAATLNGIKDLCYVTENSTKFETNKYSENLIVMPKIIFEKTNFESMIKSFCIIDMQFTKLKQIREKKLYKKITNENGYILEPNLNEFYKYLTYKFNLTEKTSPFLSLDYMESLFNSLNKSARHNANFSLDNLINRMHKIYQNQLMKGLKDINKKPDKQNLENIKKAESILKTYLEFEKNAKSMESSIEPMQNMVKEIYHSLCNASLNNLIELNDKEWIMLTAGMNNPVLYNNELADALYNRCLNLGLPQGCFVILNCVDYSADVEKLEYLVTAGQDNAEFKKSYFNMLTNYDQKFLIDIFDSVEAKTAYIQSKRDCGDKGQGR